MSGGRVEPIFVGQVELAKPADALAVTSPITPDHTTARLLVRLHGEPLGFVIVPILHGRIDDAVLRVVVWGELRERVIAHLASDGLPAPEGITEEGLGGVDHCPGSTPPERPWFSVVVCTRNRPEALRVTLESLTELSYDRFEVVVVDNATSDGRTRSCFEAVAASDSRFRYAREPIAGLSRARNRGLAESSHDLVAFTDDGVLVDPLWLDGLARGFCRDPGTGCVTGLVAAAQLDSPAQLYFDQRVSWAATTEPRLYDIDRKPGDSPLFPFNAGTFGTGANFAVDKSLIEKLGGFDVALGAGSAAAGGEDLDAFIRVLRAGRSLVYEPSAVIWHLHDTEADELERHMFRYGIGLSAVMTKYLVDPETRGEIIRRVPRGLAHIATLWSRPEKAGPMRPLLLGAEVAGMLGGPLAYRRSLAHARSTVLPNLAAVRSSSNGTGESHRVGRWQAAVDSPQAAQAADPPTAAGKVSQSRSSSVDSTGRR